MSISSDFLFSVPKITHEPLKFCTNMYLDNLYNAIEIHVVFLRATAGTARRVLAIVILSVCPSVCMSVCHDPVPIQAQAR